MALKRLRCLEKKMALDTSLRDTVSGQINDLLAKGYARKLSQKEIDEFHPRCWYLPTFLVCNPNKPGKVRLVWDEAAFSHGVSLNKMLLKGPDELRVLTEVLYGFRMRRVAIAGDIEEMFHQVGVIEEDQHSQRFLWRNGDSSKRPDVYVMKVLTFGESCSPSVAQHVKNTNAKEFTNTLSRASEAIIQHHYVDDLLDSVDSVKEAIQLAKDVKLIHSKAGFKIRNWLSNSKEVLQALHQPEGNGKTFQENVEEICATKVLGLWWNTMDDIFTFSLKFTKGHEEVLKGRRIPTKRELLRVLMSIYDPLGFLAFYLVKLKVLLQEVWKSAIDWDETINHKLQDEWEAWRVLLPKVEDVRIPRCYLPNGVNKQALVQLHVFVDASEDAMAAVVYLRYEDGGSVDCVIVSAKCKVAPLKPLSIPRLELQAALIGARLANTIVKTHAGILSRRFLWTDSRNVLCWLQADVKRFKPFVMFRVGEILELTEKDEWKWVPTKMNVADLATKWTKAPTFHPISKWFKGPEFLYEPEERWPGQPELVEEQKEELRPQFLLLKDIIANEAIIDVSRLERWRMSLDSPIIRDADTAAWR